jgi:hypothetical protein
VTPKSPLGIRCPCLHRRSLLVLTANQAGLGRSVRLFRKHLFAADVWRFSLMEEWHCYPTAARQFLTSNASFSEGSARPLFPSRYRTSNTKVPINRYEAFIVPVRHYRALSRA